MFTWWDAVSLGLGLLSVGIAIYAVADAVKSRRSTIEFRRDTSDQLRLLLEALGVDETRPSIESATHEAVRVGLVAFIAEAGQRVPAKPFWDLTQRSPGTSTQRFRSVVELVGEEILEVDGPLRGDSTLTVKKDDTT